MDVSSRFPRFELYELDKCPFCSWQKENELRVSEEIWFHSPFSTPKDRDVVYVRSAVQYFYNNLKPYAVQKDGIHWDTRFLAPNIFDASFGLITDRANDALELVYHVPNCTAGWLFNAQDHLKRFAYYRSLNNPAYSHLVERIYKEGSAEELSRLMAYSTVGFLLVMHEHELIDMTTTRKTISNNLFATTRNLRRKLSVLLNGTENERYFDVLSAQTEKPLRVAEAIVATAPNLEMMKHRLFGSRWLPRFKYMSHYRVYGRNYSFSMRNFKISAPQGNISK